MFVICKPCVGLTVYGSPSDESGGHIRGYRLHHDQHQQHQSGGGLQTGKQGKVLWGKGGGFCTSHRKMHYWIFKAWMSLPLMIETSLTVRRKLNQPFSNWINVSVCVCRWKARWINSISFWRLTLTACLSPFCYWRRRNTQHWWLSLREMANTPQNKSSKAWTLCAETGVTWPKNVASQWTELQIISPICPL